jgi:hypothetical protein
VPARIIAWDYQRVWVEVPDDAETGLIYISSHCGEISNEVHFTVQRPEEE